MRKKSINIQKFTLASMFTAIIFLMQFTPIGYIRTGFINATIIHVPVIIGSIMLGPKIGAFLGGMFGVTSIINNTITPNILSFVFSPLIPLPGSTKGSMLALVVCFIPRILVGIVPCYTYQLLIKHIKAKPLALAVAGVAGSMTNTLFVMHLIYFIFKDAYSSIRNISSDLVYKAVLTVIAMNGIPEALVAGILTVALGSVLLVYYHKYSARGVG